MPWDNGTFIASPDQFVNHAAVPSVVGVASAGATIGVNPTGVDPVPPPDGSNWLPQSRLTDSASAVNWVPVVGTRNLESIEWQHLLRYAQPEYAPFIAGVVLAGMSEPLSPEQATYLNEHFGVPTP